MSLKDHLIAAKALIDTPVLRVTLQFGDSPVTPIAWLMLAAFVGAIAFIISLGPNMGVLR